MAKVLEARDIQKKKAPQKKPVTGERCAICGAEINGTAYGEIKTRRATRKLFLCFS